MAGRSGTARGRGRREQQAGVVYVSDEEPGIARRRCGRGFAYYDAAGCKIDDETTLTRIRALAIPPAWRDTWICPDPRGHIQATGRDQRGRKQYRYHDQWLHWRRQAKFDQLADFVRALPSLRRVVDRDLARGGLGQARVVALTVRLLDSTLIRIGNPEYARTNRSFGLTTLRKRHAGLEGDCVRFEFTGKSGRQWRLGLRDRRVARAVRRVHELPGQQLFQYLDSSGQRQPLRSEHVNDYIRDAAGERFSSKSFRTWGATLRALALFAGTPRPEGERQARQVANRLVDRVARRLGNSRAICRDSYIHPAILEAWQAGHLAAEVQAVRRSVRRPMKGLDLDETIALRWLEQSGAKIR